jgi:HlyD family secretion protein
MATGGNLKLNKSIWIVILSATLFGMIFLAGFASSETVSGKIPVKVSAALRKDISSDLPALGTVIFLAKADVSSEVDGLLQSVSVEEGDTVAKGQVIAVIDRTLLEVQLKQARAALELEELNLPKWKYEVKKVEFRVEKNRIALQNYLDLFESQEKLFKSGGISRARLSRAEIDYQNALAEYKTALEDLKSLQSKSKQGRLEVEARIEKARADTLGIRARLEKCLIKAPISGIVSEKKKWTGEKTTPNNAVIVTILQTNEVYAEVELSEKNVGRLNVGQDAEVRADAYPGQIFTGKVHRISPTIDINSRTVGVKIRVSNEKQLLKPGMFIRANIILDQIKNALVVPPEAILTAKDGRQQVFVVVDGAAFLRNVQTGQRWKNQVVILQGIKTDEMVVIEGQEHLKDLSSVEVVETVTP